MKKLGFVVPWYGDNIPGGAESLVRNMIAHFIEAGIETEILTTCVEKFASDWNNNFYKPGEYKAENGAKIIRFPIRKRDVQAFDAVNAKLIAGTKISAADEEIFNREMINSPELISYMGEHQDDYHCFLYSPYMFGTCYEGCRKYPEKSVMIPCFHDESYFYMESFKEVFSKVKGMFFNAEPEYELTKANYDLSNVKCLTLGTGVDTHIDGDIQRFRAKFQVGGAYIVYAGRKDAGKNVDTLIKYFREYIKRNNADLKLILMGGGKIGIPADIRERVKDLGFVDVQDKYDGMKGSLLLCQPSKHESFSLVIMESWLLGRPVIVSGGCEVTKNFAIKAKGGLYFDDYYEFEGAINYIMEHSTIADQMGQNGKKFVQENFDWDVIIKKAVDFLEKLYE